MVRASVASLLRLPTKLASQGAQQADGVTHLEVVVETKIDVSCGHETFKICALVVENLDVGILAAMPFMQENDVAVRSVKKQIVIHGPVVVSYGQQPQNSSATARLTQAHLLRLSNLQSVLPGEFIELSTPPEVQPGLVWALEPRYDITPKMDSQTVWPLSLLIIWWESSTTHLNQFSSNATSIAARYALWYQYQKHLPQ